MAVAETAAPPVVRLHTVHALRGPSRWCMRPVVSAELAPCPGADAAAVHARVAELAPGEPAPEELAHSLARLALWLQAAAGAPVSFAGARHAGEGRWKVAVEYEEEAAAWQALGDAAALVTAWLRGDEPDVDAAVARVAGALRMARPGLLGSAVAEEARRRGIPVRRLGGTALQLGTGSRLRRLRGALCAATSAEGVATTRSAEALQALLLSLGVPVPLSFPAASPDEAVALARQLQYPVALEVEGPDGATARHPGVADDDALRALWPAEGSATRVQVASQADGPEHSALVVGGDLRSVVDLEAPGRGAVAVHPELRDACERVARALGLPVAALRFRSPAPAAPWAAHRTACTGVDADPELEPHGEEAARAAAAHLLDLLYPPGAAHSIPVVAVTGTNGKTTTARLITHLLRLRGSRVGLQHTEGVFAGDRLLVRGDPPSALAAPLLLSNPEVEAAVFETARGGILSHGLPVDRVDVGVVMNVTSDHLGDGGVDTLEELAWVKGVVAAAVAPEGHAVLNADDPRVRAMAARVPGKVALFSVQGAGVEAHVAAGGVAAVLEDGAYVVRAGAVRASIARVEEVPLAFSGAARFQHENVLAALAAGYALAIPVETLRAGVLSFHPTPEMNRGRMNLLRAGHAWAVVDYAHNVESMRAVAEFARAFPAPRRLAVVGMSASRRDEDILACGRALAPGFDHVILRERDRSTHRPDGEVAHLLATGLTEGGLDPARHEVVLRESAAVERALSLAGPGDLVVLLANNVDAVLAQLRALPPAAEPSRGS